MNCFRLIPLAAVLLFVACESKDAPKTEGAIAISTADAFVTPGLYRSEKITQTSFRDYNAKETVFSEVKLEGDKVTYISYRDDKEISRKVGTYDPKHHAFLFLNQGTGENDKDMVAEVSAAGFKLKHGRLVHNMKRVP